MKNLERLGRLIESSADRENPSPRMLLETLKRVGTIAVVGLSRDPMKDARRVPSYLAAKGYEVIPVNPNALRVLGRVSHPDLDHVREPVDLVLVFRPSDEAGGVIRLAAGRPERPLIWLQEGIMARTDARAARADGITVVQDLCLFKVHRAIEDELLPRPRLSRMHDERQSS